MDQQSKPKTHAVARPMLKVLNSDNSEQQTDIEELVEASEQQSGYPQPALYDTYYIN
jgi:hypothetical protein